MSGVPEVFVVVRPILRPLKIQEPCSIFHIGSNGDEGTGKKPCHQAFLVGRGRGVPRECIFVLQRWKYFDWEEYVRTV